MDADFSLKNLKRVEDLIYFDGPLLSHFKDENNRDYLYYWCDVDENFNRWLVIGVENLKDYLIGKLSLREIIESATFLYRVDIDGNFQYHDFHPVDWRDLPESYLPETDTWT